MGGRGQKRGPNGRFVVNRWQADTDVPESMKTPGLYFIKFVEGNNSLPAESNSPKAIYAIRNKKGQLSQIGLYDENCHIFASYDFDHDHGKGMPHFHYWRWSEEKQEYIRPGLRLNRKRRNWLRKHGVHVEENEQKKKKKKSR